MGYGIQYGDRLVEIKPLSKLSFAEYNYIIKILADNKYTVEEQYQEILLTLTVLTPEEILKIEDITQVNLQEVLSQQMKSKSFKTEYKGNKIININKIHIGRFIDIEYFLLSPDLDDKIETITALMYIETEFDESALEALKKDIVDNMKIGEALQVVSLFTEFRNKIYKDYEGLFRLSDDGEEEEDIIISPDKEDSYDEDDDETNKNSWGMMEYVYYLANDNMLNVDKILEKNIFEVLNYLTWKKEKNDEELAREKQRALTNK